ncbi:MAG: heme-degrading domain-containing protein [Eubacteriales bacterium]
MKLEQAISILKEQEEKLVFSQFTNEDAWNIGCAIVKDAMEHGYQIATSIRLNNGYVVFQHGCAGSNLDNEFWMTRKSNSVKRLEMSSLRLWAQITEQGEKLENRFMDPKEYALCGGGFPIIVKNVGVIGTIMVSGLDHIADHNMIVDHVAEYLGRIIDRFEEVEV